MYIDDNLKQSEHCDHDDHHDHDSLCHQCGKVHSIFFIQEHHCLEETLREFFGFLFEQITPSSFKTRAPPSI